MNSHDPPKPPIHRPANLAGALEPVWAEVVVSGGDVAQVAFADGTGTTTMEITGVQFGRVELLSERFLPKGCRVSIVSDCLGKPSTGGKSSLAGVVRTAKTVGLQPTYALTIDLDKESSTSLLASAPKNLIRRHSIAPIVERRGRAKVGLPGWAAVLCEVGGVSEDQVLAEAQQAAAVGDALEDRLSSARIATVETIAACMALDLSVVYVEPGGYSLAPANRSLIPFDLAKSCKAYPLFKVGEVITLAMEDPTNLAVIDQIRLRTKMQIDPCICPPGSIDLLIKVAYRDEEFREDPAAPKAPARGAAPAPVASGAAGSTERLVTQLLAEAVSVGASDIHVEPERTHLRVRSRIDGILHETNKLPLSKHAPIISRMKVQAGLDITETRRAQDGHFGQTIDGQLVDVRLSTIPTVHGENAVLRLMVSDGESKGLEEIGMSAAILESTHAFLDHPNGMVLVTGPTGSGKTSTLYAALDRLNTIDKNVTTVEDPVERRVPSLRQTEVNPKAGMTFASGLRSLLRQDPDVIMVGEIRDQETAEMAVQASLTGHLVLSTLHTNTAAGAIVRLSEMGVAPFLLTSSLRAVLGQRLVRRICDTCKVDAEPRPELLDGFGLRGEAIAYKKGAGCAQCMKTGYRGRVGIFELLEINEALAKAILGGASREEIEREAARSTGNGLHHDGVRKVRLGETTLEEVARVVGVKRISSPEEEG